MADNLKGKTQLKARFVAVSKDVTRPTAELWQKRATQKARQIVGGYQMPYSKGDLERSIRIGTVRVQAGKVVQAKVTMEYHGYFVDAGTQGEGTSSRFNRFMLRRGISGQMATDMGLRTVFTKNGSRNRTNFSAKARRRRGGGYAARPFRERAAVEAMKNVSMARILTDAWNGAS